MAKLRSLAVLLMVSNALGVAVSQTHIVPSPVTINTFGGGAGCVTVQSDSIERRMQQLEEKVNQQQTETRWKDLYRNDLKSWDNTTKDCADIYSTGQTTSGVYFIRPEGYPRPFPVFCLFDDEGQWTVIQRRVDGKVDFQRCWTEYKRGFGEFDGSFWLGLEKIRAIVTQRQYQLRIDITDWDEQRKHASYKFFEVADEDDQYRLRYFNYTGTAGDALAEYHYNMTFSTLDRDNDRKTDEHCAVLHGGGWWYNDCDTGNLNGKYNLDRHIHGPTDTGIEWDPWKQLYSFKGAMMRIKPAYND